MEYRDILRVYTDPLAQFEYDQPNMVTVLLVAYTVRAALQEDPNLLEGVDIAFLDTTSGKHKVLIMPELPPASFASPAMRYMYSSTVTMDTIRDVQHNVTKFKRDGHMFSLMMGPMRGNGRTIAPLMMSHQDVVWCTHRLGWKDSSIVRKSMDLMKMSGIGVPGCLPFSIAI